MIIDPYRYVAAPVGAPLDGYTTSLWGAYGLQKLLTAYTGPLIKVRRSSDDATQDIGSSGGVLDTATLATWGGSDSVYIETCYDQSGGGNDISQATTGYQPRIVNAGAYDGKIVFDGSDDSLVSITNSGTPSAFTVHVKGKMRTTPGNFCGLFEQNPGYTSAGNSAICYYKTSAGPGSLGVGLQAGMCQGATSSVVSFSPLPNDDVWSIRLDRPSSLADLYVNGSSSGASGADPFAVSGNFGAGVWKMCGQPGNAVPMNVYTWVIYEANQSGGTIASVAAAIA